MPERSEKIVYDWRRLAVNLCVAYAEIFPGEIFEEVMNKEFLVTIDQLAREALFKDLELFAAFIGLTLSDAMHPDAHQLESWDDIGYLFSKMARALEDMLALDTTDWTVVTIADVIFDTYVLGDILDDTLDRLDQRTVEIIMSSDENREYEAALRRLRDRVGQICLTGFPSTLLRDIYCKNDFIIKKVLARFPGVVAERLALMARTNQLDLGPRRMVQQLM